MLAMATKVVDDYGKILNGLDAALYGQPLSSLPHAKASIREAILTLFEQGDSLPPEIREGLIHGFVYLAQFVPDDEARMIAEGQQHLREDGMPGEDAPAIAVQALIVINRIKLEMESALEEIQALA
jgi:hypothetical protein